MEQPNTPDPSHPPFAYNEAMETRVHLSVGDINVQLTVTKPRYLELLEKIEAGEEIHNQEYWADYKENLIIWANNIRVSHGTLSKGNKEVLAEVEGRLAVISKVLDGTI